MFNDLLVRNFEIHKKTYFKFVRGLNMIVGPTDSGKSTIVRVIEWIVKNRPTGDAFRRYPNKIVSAESTFNHTPLHRYKKKKVNAYKIGDKELTHVGTEVPDAVSDLLNLGEENIQTQDEFFFLLSDSPGQVAKKLNSIGGLEIMDSILQAVNKDIRSLNASRKAIFKSMDYAKGFIKDLAWTKKAHNKLFTIEKLRRENKKLKKKIDTVKNVSAKMYGIQHKLSRLLDKEVGKEIKVLSKMSAENEKLYHKIDNVQLIVDDFEDTKAKLKALVIPDIKPLRKAVEKGAVLKEKIKRVDKLIRKQHELKERIFILDGDIEKAKKKYAFTLQQLEECPTCGATTV